MATLQDFYPWVQIDCAGVPVPVLNDAILKGAREFCKLTGCLVEVISITTTPGQKDYTLVLPSATEVVSVNYVKRNEAAFLAPVTINFIESHADVSGAPVAFSLVETLPISVRLYPTPIETEDFSVSVNLMPDSIATEVDDRLLKWYQEGITAYAKYYLLSQQSKPWSDAQKAAFEFRRFENRISETRINRARWRAGIPSSVFMNPFV